MTAVVTTRRRVGTFAISPDSARLNAVPKTCHVTKAPSGLTGGFSQYVDPMRPNETGLRHPQTDSALSEKFSADEPWLTYIFQKVKRFRLHSGPRPRPPARRGLAMPRRASRANLSGRTICALALGRDNRAKMLGIWSEWRDSNSRPLPPEDRSRSPNH